MAGGALCPLQEAGKAGKGPIWADAPGARGEIPFLFHVQTAGERDLSL